MNYKKLSRVIDGSEKYYFYDADSKIIDGLTVEETNQAFEKLIELAEKYKGKHESFEGEHTFEFPVNSKKSWEDLEFEFGNLFYDLGLADDYSYDADDSARSISIKWIDKVVDSTKEDLFEEVIEFLRNSFEFKDSAWELDHGTIVLDFSNSSWAASDNIEALISIIRDNLMSYNPYFPWEVEFDEDRGLIYIG